MKSLPDTSQIDQRDTHRLIPAQFADDGASVLSRLSDDDKLLEGIFELDNATNDRLWAESGRAPAIDARELVFGIPSYRIINAAFCHPAPNGARFNSPDRGAWYASFELSTSQAEAAYHKQTWLRKLGGTKKRLAITSIIRLTFARSSTIFAGQAGMRSVCLLTAMALRRHLRRGFWRRDRRGLFIPACGALEGLVSGVFGRCW